MHTKRNFFPSSDKSDRLVIGELEVIFEMDHECHKRKKEEEDPAKDDHKFDGKGRFLAGVFFTPEQRMGKVTTCKVA